MHDLVKKKEDGSYTLSEFGRAGLGLIQRVEEPVTNTHRKRQSLFAQIFSIAIIVILSFSAWSLYSGNQSLKSDLTIQKTQVETLQSYIQTLTNRAPSRAHELIPNQARYYVGDTIYVTLSYVNPTNQTLRVSSFPSIIRYSGHYSSDENYNITEIEHSQTSGDWIGVVILPYHVWDVYTMSFWASKVGTFEIRCNDLVKTIQVYPTTTSK